MIDFHSHILPGMDDGAKSVQMSLEMLKKSAKDGVTDILSTSHCYPRDNGSFVFFLEGREKSFAELSEAMEKDGGVFPKIHLGCELNLRCDAASFKDIGKMCIENTDYILVEMPFEPWNERTIEWVYNLKVLGLNPVMAHIDRFLNQKDSVLNSLFELDLLYQVNTEAILDRRMEKQLRRLFEYGYIHVLGTDMHNMSARKPNMAEAAAAAEKKFGGGCIIKLSENAEDILNNKQPRNSKIDIEAKKTIFTKIFQKN